jgi:endo-1,4-beta-xylanase
LASTTLLVVLAAFGCGSSGGDSGTDGNASGGSGTGGVSSIGGAATGSGGSGLGGAGTDGPPVVNAACPGDATHAYQGTARAIAGTVQAEDFDPGGYSDSSDTNEGGAYRTDEAVDIKAFGSGYAVGWMTNGEWLEYTVNVETEGDYDLVLQAGAVDAGRTLLLSSCGTALATVDIPQIADWGTVSATAPVTVHLGAGLQVLRITVGASDYVDFDSMTFQLKTAGPGSGGASGSGGSGSGGTDGSGGSATGGTGGGGAVTKFVGNITTGYNAALDYGGRTYSTYWDQVTPENAGKWGSVQGSAGATKNWSTLDAIYDYTETHGITFKQHVFVWGAQQPSGTLTETDVKNWMSQFCARYPHTKLIDVVNEPPPHTTPSYADAIGGGTNSTWTWITNAFKWADAACPNAILILNDYNNIEYGDQNQHFIDIVKTIQAAGAPIDAIGAQSHGLGGSVSTSTMKTLITKMHTDTGLPVYVTEYDIDLADDTAQLNKYKEHIPFFYETEWIHGVTIWGWIYGQTWVTSSGLIKDGNPRPAMTWLMDYLNRPAP